MSINRKTKRYSHFFFTKKKVNFTDYDRRDTLNKFFNTVEKKS